MPQLDVPHFRYGKNGSGGVRAGRWRSRSAHRRRWRRWQTRRRQRPRRQRSAGQHILEVDVTLEELAADSSATNSNCRASSPKEINTIGQEKAKYDDHPPHRPRMLRHRKRTYLQALRRQITTVRTTPTSPPSCRCPRTNATVLGARCCSRSQRARHLHDGRLRLHDRRPEEIVRTEAFWLDTWLNSQYDGARSSLHHSRCRGPASSTKKRSITPAKAAARASVPHIRRASELIRREFILLEWNIYGFQFSLRAAHRTTPGCARPR